jgi:hypothetical protein
MSRRAKYLSQITLTWLFGSVNVHLMNWPTYHPHIRRSRCFCTKNGIDDSHAQGSLRRYLAKQLNTGNSSAGVPPPRASEINGLVPLAQSYIVTI